MRHRDVVTAGVRTRPAVAAGGRDGAHEGARGLGVRGRAAARPPSGQQGDRPVGTERVQGGLERQIDEGGAVELGREGVGDAAQRALEAGAPLLQRVEAARRRPRSACAARRPPPSAGRAAR
jgi:hypothetical protein